MKKLVTFMLALPLLVACEKDESEPELLTVTYEARCNCDFDVRLSNGRSFRVSQEFIHQESILETDSAFLSVSEPGGRFSVSAVRSDGAARIESEVQDSVGVFFYSLLP